jgi:N-acetyl-gamma-glutamyl-phosphate reductase
VIPAYRGMVVEVPLVLAATPNAASPDMLRASLAEAYLGCELVTVHEEFPEELLLRRSMEPNDRLDLYVTGARDSSQVRLIARLDNLGKGASGAAVQNLNLMAGLPETAGLRL